MTRSRPTVVSVFNRYRERGGEEEVVDAEADLLERHGWRVLRATARSRDPVDLRDRLRLARDGFWSSSWRRDLGRTLARERPDVVHVHNTFPLISPAVLYACREAGVPVVHTLHNYRLFCAAATLFRDGRPCRDCVGRLPWPALLHRCYQRSLPRTLVAAGAQALHRALGSWRRGVDLFIAPTAFSRRIFVEAGLPAARVAVKPNFVHPDPGPSAGPGEYALFAGSLSEGKGVGDLVAAWRQLEVPLRVVGGGPLEGAVRELAARRPNVEYLGRRGRIDVLSALGGARFLVFPSRWYECCPLAVLEAFARGVPVLAADGGAAAEMIEGGALGWSFPAGRPRALAAVAAAAWADDAGARERGRCARLAFERRYTAGDNYRRLAKLYRRVRRRPAAEAPRRRRAGQLDATG